MNYDKWMRLTKDELVDELQSALRSKRRWMLLAIALGVAALMLLDGFVDGFLDRMSNWLPIVGDAIWIVIKVAGIIALAAWIFVWLDRRYKRQHNPSGTSSSDSPDDHESNTASDEGSKSKKAKKTGRKWPVDLGSSLGARKSARDQGGQS